VTQESETALPSLVRRAPWGVVGVLGGLGALLSIPLHVWMHKDVPGAAAILGGFLGGGLPPLLLAPIWSDLPAFLRRPLDSAVSLVGVGLVLITSALDEGVLYALLRRDELIASVLTVSLVSVGIASLVETHRRLAAVIATREKELAAERRAAVEAQLRALQAQIRPHFLFNTLSALSELIHQDADAADDMVTDLAHLLRYSLRSSAEGEVPLADELAAIERYLRIEGARLGDRLRVTIDVPPAVRRETVPGLILQPLVENAVQHGVASRAEGGAVRILAERGAVGLRLVVEDDGPGLSDDALAKATGTGGHGGGFANVRRRLALRFGEAAALDVGSRDGGGTRIAMVLPRAPESEEETG